MSEPTTCEDCGTEDTGTEDDGGPPWVCDYCAGYRAGRGVAPSGIGRIARERARQITVEGWTPEHDDVYHDGELTRAAAGYLLAGCHPRPSSMRPPRDWPLSWSEWWKPGDGTDDDADQLRCMEKAGALIAAEIDRMLRENERRREEEE